MSEHKNATLTYRTDGEFLDQLIETFGRRGSMEVVQQTFTSGNAFPGTVLAAKQLGFIDEDEESLLEAGSDYYLHEERRPELLLKAMIQFEPYSLLLDTVLLNRQESETSTDWIAKWWTSSNYGSSPNNRDEGATTFAKLLEKAGMGKFMIGRRGKSTRIQWASDAKSRLSAAHASLDKGQRQSTIAAVDTFPSENSVTTTYSDPLPPRSQGVNTADSSQSESGYVSLSVPLGTGMADVRLPARVTRQDKQRFLQLMDLLIVATDEVSITSHKVQATSDEEPELLEG